MTFTDSIMTFEGGHRDQYRFTPCPPRIVSIIIPTYSLMFQCLLGSLAILCFG